MSGLNVTKAAIGRLKYVLRGDASSLFARHQTTDGVPNSAPPTSPSADAKAENAQGKLQSLRMREIDAEHDVILDRFEETARLGHVPADALIGQLYANRCAALAETKRQLGDVEEALAATLRRLDARFPAPLPPAPDKPLPPRRRHFRPLADIWIKPPRPRPFSTAQ